MLETESFYAARYLGDPESQRELALYLDAPDTPSLHLDTVEGRVWLQIE